MAREIYPHDRLTDAYYQKVVEDLDAEAGKDAEVAKLLRNGVADLNRAAGGDFAKLHSDAQVAELKKSKIRRFSEGPQHRSGFALQQSRSLEEVRLPGRFLSDSAATCITASTI